jgi:hypothetical protein
MPRNCCTVQKPVTGEARRHFVALYWYCRPRPNAPYPAGRACGEVQRFQRKLCRRGKHGTLKDDPHVNRVPDKLVIQVLYNHHRRHVHARTLAS